MKRYASGLVGIVLNPFLGYIAPQLENSFASGRCGPDTHTLPFNSEKLCLLIFVFALAFIALISPVLCLGSLFIELHLEGLWYFWLITFSEIVYSAWLITRKIAKK